MNLSEISLKNLLANRKLVIAVIILLLILEGIWAYKRINQSTQGNFTFSGQTKAPVVQRTATMSLTTVSNTVRVGDKLTVSINVESNVLSDGIDVIINYDPTKLSVIANSLKMPVSTTSLFNTYPLNKFDQTNGKIYLSGISSLGSLTPRGEVGKITFQAKNVGSTVIAFQFTKGRTDDTNVTETKTAQDVLSSVNNLTINITK